MIDVTAAASSTRPRRRAAAALAAVAVGAAALLISLQSGAAADPGPAAVRGAQAVPVARAGAAPVTSAAGKVKLTVDPAAGLTAAGATLAVTGSGYDTGTGIYVAICHADGKAPASLRDCVGGAIPNGNTSKSWAHMSDDAGSADGAPAATKWGPGGSFSVQLALPASDSSSDTLDCSKVPCAVYTTPDDGKGTAENLSVPLVYAAPVTTSSSPTTSTSSSTTPSSSTPSSSSSPTTTPSSTASSSTSSSPEFSTSSAVVATTVQAKSVRSPTIVAGGMQEVLFAGFAKNEPVTVTLYSAPQSLPATRADQDGIVKVDFTVPANLEPATHLLRVVGQISKVTGVASFVVTAPVVSSSAVVVPSTPATSSIASSSAPVSSAAPVPATLSSASVASSAPVSSAIAPVVPPASSGRSVVWPWYALAVLVVIILAVVTYLLRRRSRLAAERRENDALLADAAAAEHQRNLDAIARANADAPTQLLGDVGPGFPPALPAGGYGGYHPGEHGLLSGRDHPDSPGLLSGTGYRGLPPVDPPTTVLPDERTTFLPGEDRTTQLPGEPTTQLPGGRTTQLPVGRAPGSTPAGDEDAAGDEADAGGPPTGHWQPDDQDRVAGGPPTGSWRPDFDDGVDGDNEPSGSPGSPGASGSPTDEPDAQAGGGGRHSRPS